MSARDEAGPATPATDDEQVLGFDAGPGLGRAFLDSLSPGAVVAYRGEPTASERALLCWPMSEEERQRFARSIESGSTRLREMDADEVERFVGDLESATASLNLGFTIEDYDVPGSQDTPGGGFSRGGGAPTHTSGSWISRHAKRDWTTMLRLYHRLRRVARPDRGALVTDSSWD